MEEGDILKLKGLIEELESYRGRHTELISAYAPAGSNINQLASQLLSEQSTAQNIKSKTTKTNVIDALERIIRHLKLYKRLPDNGLAIFCGNISKVEGQPDLKIWAIEPPQELKTRFYRCDQTFVLEPLKEMVEVQEVYGLVVVDRKEATIAVLEGKMIKILRRATSGAPGKVKAGGQSAARFDRIREELTKEFYRRVADNVKEVFFDMKKLQGIIVGGPGPTKEDFLKEGQLVTALQKKVIAIKDIGYADEHGIELLVEASQDVLVKEAITKEKAILEKFFSMLAKDPKMTVYGMENVKRALEAGAIEHLLVSTTLDKKIIFELEKAAHSISAQFHFISIDTNEGLQFKNFAGVGALLRYAI